MLLSIGAVARLSGASQAAIRVWEREGLVQPTRTPGGHRLYTPEDLERLQHIQYLRRFRGINAAAIRLTIAPPVVTETTQPAIDPALGPRLRALRKEMGLALAEVAARAGLSISFLSAVERGQSGIALGNLFRLADAYGTTVPGLRANAPSQDTPSERPRYIANSGRVIIEDLITTPGAIEAQRIEIAPGGESEDSYSHPGEEFVYVLEGELTFWLDEREKDVLHTGDSLYLPSTRPHSWRNEGGRRTLVLWMNVPLVEGAPRPGGAGRRLARRRPGAPEVSG
jgi:DNA-binding transcriptional MerR regulator/quercetin dioxygenase-like cupin family protein